MKLNLYTSEKHLDHCSESWNKVGDTAFFTLPIIQKAWWRSHQKPQLKIVEIEDEKKIIGVIALCSFDDGHTLQFLGDQDVSDYLDWIVNDPEKAQAGVEQFLLEDKTWQKIELVSLPEASTFIPALAKIAAKNNWQFVQEQQDICPIISLPVTWPEYLQQIGKKQRHEIQRKWKRLSEQAQLDFRTVTDISQDLTSLDLFKKLHSASSVEKAAFWTDEHSAYFAELTQAASKNGSLRLYFLDINSEPAATMYCFEYHESLLVYNSGFDASKFLEMSPGQVLTAFTIQDAIERGMKTYDFLRGAEEYKSRYGTMGVPVFNVTVTRELP